MLFPIFIIISFAFISYQFLYLYVTYFFLYFADNVDSEDETWRGGGKEDGGGGEEGGGKNSIVPLLPKVLEEGAEPSMVN